MEFEDVVRRRRMHRRYSTEPVPEAALERMMRAFRKAPSAGFTQGVSLVIVTDPDRRRSIAGLAGEARYRERGFEPWLSEAPVHLVLCVSEADYRARYAAPDKSGSPLAGPAWPVPYWWVDAGAGLMMLLLAAVDEGLAAGFLGAHAVPGLAGALGLPSDVTPVGIVTIGYPAPEPPRSSPRPGRRPAGEVIHREWWGGVGRPT